MTGEWEVETAVRSVLGDVPTEVTILASGAVSIVVKVPGRDVVVIDGNAERTQWGVSGLTADSNPYVGHDQVAESLDEALALAGDLLAGR